MPIRFLLKAAVFFQFALAQLDESFCPEATRTVENCSAWCKEKFNGRLNFYNGEQDICQATEPSENDTADSTKTSTTVIAGSVWDQTAAAGGGQDECGLHGTYSSELNLCICDSGRTGPACEEIETQSEAGSGNSADGSTENIRVLEEARREQIQIVYLILVVMSCANCCLCCLSVPISRQHEEEDKKLRLEVQKQQAEEKQKPDDSQV